MTTTVSVLVPEGIALAADSRQVVRCTSGQLRVDSDNANKIFQINSRIAISVYGQGFFYPGDDTSPRNIGMIVRGLSKHLPENCTIAKAANIIQQKITEDVNRHCDVTGVEQAEIAFHIAGYNSDSEIGELYSCQIPGQVSLERKTSDAGMVWSGQREVINRLILGYDERFLELLTFSENHAGSSSILRQQLRKLQLHIRFQTMPLQDAVDLAEFMVRATIEAQRFADGIVGIPGQTPVCGGAIDLAVLTPDKGFCWLRHKQL